MPKPPAGVDPEEPGSRFTLRPALAISGLHDGDGADAPSNDEAVREVLGPEALAEPLEGLGRGTTLTGSVGRGGEGWAVVVEWVAKPAVGAVVGGLAWASAKAASRAFGSLMRRTRPEGASVLVSRGAAALIAIDYLLSVEDPEELFIQAVDEPSSLAGFESPESNYVGIEPWVVLLIDPILETRYVVVVRPNGEVRGHMRTPMEDVERDYLPRPTDEH
jgi:hypothetical protein